MPEFAITFQQRYRHDTHPVDERITDRSFVVIDAEDEHAAREEAFKIFGQDWAFLYPWHLFHNQIDEFGLVELELDSQASAE